MPVTRHKIRVSQAKVGMFVSELDRVWRDTPLPAAGFRIADSADIRRLARWCNYLYIDAERSDPAVLSMLRAPLAFAPPKAPPPRTLADPDGRAHAAFTKTNEPKPQANILDLRTGEHRPYRVSTELHEELPQARAAIGRVVAVADTMVSELRWRRGFSLATLKRALAPLVDSMVRNPDACIWLSRLKGDKEYLHKHSVATAVWAVALGRVLALPEWELHNLALGGLLLDIGKLKLPSALLQKQTPLNRAEQAHVQAHVQFGLAELRATHGINRQVWDMVAGHHERHNGGGYPRGLRGGAIPLFARIGAIADCYDALTSERPYASSVSPLSAQRKMLQGRDSDFQPELIDEFFESLGTYPAGTLVELSTGEVAVVVAGGGERKLRPEVLMLLDNHKAPIADYHSVDLGLVEFSRVGGAMQALDVIATLPSGSYGLNSAFIQQAAAHMT
mgnify:CR=1 FL=1